MIFGTKILFHTRDIIRRPALRYQNRLFIKKLYRNSATAAGEAGNGALWCRRGMVPHGRWLGGEGEIIMGGKRKDGVGGRIWELLILRKRLLMGMC